MIGMDMSFSTMWEAVARILPGAVAISEPGRDYTYAEFDDRASRLATALEVPESVPAVPSPAICTTAPPTWKRCSPR